MEQLNLSKEQLAKYESIAALQNGRHVGTPKEYKKPFGRKYGDYELISIDEVRKRLDTIKKEEERMACKYQFLTQSRVSEAVDSKDTNYAPLAGYASEHEVKVPTKDNPEGEWVRAALFITRTAKKHGSKKGQPRPALLSMDHDPWAEPLLRYFQEFDKEEKVFKHSHRNQQRLTRIAFEAILWPFKEYTNKETGEVIQAGWRSFNTHAYRKARTLDLIYNHGFTDLELCIFGGWEAKTLNQSVPEVLTHYTHLGLRSVELQRAQLLKLGLQYFEKLVNPRPPLEYRDILEVR